VQPLFQAVDINFRTTEKVFTIERCLDCGVAQTSPRPEKSVLGQFYPRVYYPTGGLDPRTYNRRTRQFQKDKLAIVRRHRAGGRLLDVGCGAGYFVREASLAGFDAEGVEFDAEAADFGRKAWNLRIVVGDLLGAGFADESFDVITLWQVLEHLPHPSETLMRIHRLLRRRGLLVVAVPNFASLQSRVFRDRWYHLEVPRHLFHYDPVSLRALLMRHHFAVLSEDHHSREHNWAGIMGSVISFSPLRPSLAGAVGRKFIGRPLSKIAAGVETAFGNGGTFSVCAEKQE
jgi:SAM-dependent methyltransferase